MTQAAQFRRAVIDNKPQGGSIGWRTVIQYATEMGAFRQASDGAWAERFDFPDGSHALVRGLMSGSPQVWARR